MEDFKELYILGEPIDTKLGQIHFVKVNEYSKFLNYVPYLSLEKNDIIGTMYLQFPEIATYFKEKELIEIIRELAGYYDLYDIYCQLFNMCFRNDVFDKIKDDQELNMYRKMICKMNCVAVEEKNPNAEIQYFNDLKKIYSQAKNDPLTFEAIFTSVWLEVGVDPSDLTVYQLHALFNRIMQMKNYNTTVLYSTVSSEVKIENWFKHVDMFNESKKELTSLKELQAHNRAL